MRCDALAAQRVGNTILIINIATKSRRQILLPVHTDDELSDQVCSNANELW